MIHRPSHRNPGALWLTFPPDKLRIWCRAPGWYDGASVELLLVLRMLRSAGQALQDGWSCLALLLLLPARVYGRKHTWSEQHQNQLVLKEFSLYKLYFKERDQGYSCHILQHNKRGKGINCSMFKLN